MIIILMIVAGACNAIMDTLQFRFDKSIFKNRNPNFWDPKKSWINKYGQPLKPYTTRNGTTLRIVTPKFEELFPFSTTIFGSLTYAWHLFQKITWSCLIVARVLYEPVNIKISRFCSILC